MHIPWDSPAMITKWYPTPQEHTKDPFVLRQRLPVGHGLPSRLSHSLMSTNHNNYTLSYSKYIHGTQYHYYI